jgi:hypothetical protein
VVVVISKGVEPSKKVTPEMNFPPVPFPAPAFTFTSTPSTFCVPELDRMKTSKIPFDP